MTCLIKVPEIGILSFLSKKKCPFSFPLMVKLQESTSAKKKNFFFWRRREWGKQGFEKKKIFFLVGIEFSPSPPPPSKKMSIIDVKLENFVRVKV
jgi:hypothetical protein